MAANVRLSDGASANAPPARSRAASCAADKLWYEFVERSVVRRKPPPILPEFSASAVEWCSAAHPSVHHTTDAVGDDDSGAAPTAKPSKDAVDENDDKESPMLPPLMMLLLLLLLLFPLLDPEK